MKSLRNQKVSVYIGMGKDFQPQKSIAISGTNICGIPEIYSFSEPDLKINMRVGLIDNFVLDHQTIKFFSDYAMKNIDAMKVKSIDEVDEYVIAINQAERKILCTEGNEKPMTVLKYPKNETFKEIIDRYKVSLGYSEDYNGIITRLKDIIINSDFSFKDKSIEIYNQYNILIKEVEGNYLGNIIYIDLSTIGSKNPILNMIIENDGQRYLIMTEVGLNTLCAMEKIIPKESNTKKYIEQLSDAVKIIQNKLQNTFFDPAEFITKENSIENEEIKSQKIIGTCNDNELISYIVNNYKKDEQIYVQDEKNTYQVKKMSKEESDFHRYWKAASEGDADSQFELARMYEDGLGTNASEKNAEYWYLRAAEQFHKDAQISLGDLYLKSRFNHWEALYWYKWAAKRKDPIGCYKVGYMYENGYGRRDYEYALEWYQLSAELKYIPSFCKIGYFYEYGYACKKDYKKALEWYEKAAKLGNPEGLYRVGSLYEHGKGVELDDMIAAKWYLNATEYNNSFGKNIIEQHIRSIIAKLNSTKDSYNYIKKLGYEDYSYEFINELMKARSIENGNPDTTQSTTTQDDPVQDEQECLENSIKEEITNSDDNNTYSGSWNTEEDDVYDSDYEEDDDYDDYMSPSADYNSYDFDEQAQEQRDDYYSNLENQQCQQSESNAYSMGFESADDARSCGFDWI